MLYIVSVQCFGTWPPEIAICGVRLGFYVKNLAWVRVLRSGIEYLGPKTSNISLNYYLLRYEV